MQAQTFDFNCHVFVPCTRNDGCSIILGMSMRITRLSPSASRLAAAQLLGSTLCDARLRQAGITILLAMGRRCACPLSVSIPAWQGMRLPCFLSSFHRLAQGVEVEAVTKIAGAFELDAQLPAGSSVGSAARYDEPRLSLLSESPVRPGARLLVALHRLSWCCKGIADGPLRDPIPLMCQHIEACSICVKRHWRVVTAQSLLQQMLHIMRVCCRCYSVPVSSTIS